MTFIVSISRSLFVLIFLNWANNTINSQNTSPITDSLSRKVGIKNYLDLQAASPIISEGFLTTYKVNNRIYFEIPDSILNREVLIVNRISKAAADTRKVNDAFGYPGDDIGQNMIFFEKSNFNKIFLRKLSYQERALDSTDNGLFAAINTSNISPIVAAFDIKFFGPDSLSSVIDLTDFLGGDNDVFFFESKYKSKLGITSLHGDKSFVDSIKAFSINIEIYSTKTYSKSAPIGGLATFELNSSIVLLPEIKMKPRFRDERVGYFSVTFLDFDKDSHKTDYTSFITKWRLEPKQDDIKKYLNGELVEPEKPIVYYIDPKTPKKWIPYLMQGINDWQKTFEKAGFKNAIFAKEAPENDPKWNLYDARHNAIVYKPSDITNASGPHINDPRTGEILETHINWYHNVMKLLQSWYFVQAAAVDPRARTMHFPDSLMGQLIRFVASHEVGHTLGLMHNFGSSSTIPVDSLRSQKWLEQNGHTPSIMDYARFNYVAQPEDSITETGIFPRIGAYDEWAIEWGYRWFPSFSNEAEEKSFFRNWITTKLKGNKKLWYGSQGYSESDPRCQSEDLGEDAIKAGAYGIKNLKRIVSNLPKWVSTPGEMHADLPVMYKQVTDQFSRYLMHALKNIGGILFTDVVVGQPGYATQFVSKEKQKESVEFLIEQVFDTPEWLFDEEVFSKMRQKLMAVYDLKKLQERILLELLSPERLSRMLMNEAGNPQRAYTFKELLKHVGDKIFEELNTYSPISIYRRNLQKTYTEIIIKALITKDSKVEDGWKIANSNTDIVSIFKAHVESVILKINKAVPHYKSNEVTLYHLKDLIERFKDYKTTKHFNSQQ